MPSAEPTKVRAIVAAWLDDRQVGPGLVEERDEVDHQQDGSDQEHNRQDTEHASLDRVALWTSLEDPRDRLVERLVEPARAPDEADQPEEPERDRPRRELVQRQPEELRQRRELRRQRLDDLLEPAWIVLEHQPEERYEQEDRRQDREQ